MERTDPAEMMAASLLNNKGGSALLPWRGGGKGGSNATAIVAPREVPLSGRMGAKSVTNEINNNARGGGWEGGGGEVDDDDPLSRGDGHHHPMWDPFQSFGSVSSMYRMWLEGRNASTMQCTRQHRAQALDQLLTLRKLQHHCRWRITPPSRFRPRHRQNCCPLLLRPLRRVAAMPPTTRICSQHRRIVRHWACPKVHILALISYSC